MFSVKPNGSHNTRPVSFKAGTAGRRCRRFVLFAMRTLLIVRMAMRVAADARRFVPQTQQWQPELRLEWVKVWRAVAGKGRWWGGNGSGLLPRPGLLPFPSRRHAHHVHVIRPTI